MTIASRFLPRPEGGATLRLTIDGETMIARPGDSVAAAVLAHSGDAFRHTATGEVRTAFCMMGVCFDCLIEIDGQPNSQSCMIAVRDGMVLRRPSGLRQLIETTADV